jgi:hypothetical protein
MLLRRTGFSLAKSAPGDIPKFEFEVPRRELSRNAGRNSRICCFDC